MEEIKTIKEKTIELIDALKATCQTYGMGNDGNEYKIITQVFLYKFLNDKFGYEVKKVSPVLKNAEKWELVYAEMSEDDRLDIFDSLPSDIPLLNPEHLIANLWNQQAKGDFDLIFDSTMTDIADKNIDIFSTQTAQNTKIPLFEKLTQYVTDDTARAPFARALVDKLVNFSFEEAFEKHYDFFADIFEYLIKDYNTAGGGKYAEYYTPHAIATIMAKKILQHIVDEHIVYGCISMPSNVFANTGTNVSVLFFDNSRKTDKVVLIDASKLGEEYKDGNNQKRRLRDFEIDKIVDTFLNKEAVDDFSVAVTYDEIKEKKYSLAAGQYFDVKIEYVELSQDEFNARMSAYAEKLQEYFAEGDKLKTEIMEQLKKVKYE